MGFLDSLLGRSKPAKANLDVLFSVPQAALTLESGGGFTFTGVGSVCYRPNEGAAFLATEKDIEALLNAADGTTVERTDDAFGFRWLKVERPTSDVAGLVTDLHAVNASLTDAGFGQSLLCSLVNFATTAGEPVAIVYLYKRGTFFPFAPAGKERRDNELELMVRGLVAEDIPIEPDLARWFAVWGAPGLQADTA